MLLLDTNVWLELMLEVWERLRNPEVSTRVVLEDVALTRPSETS